MHNDFNHLVATQLGCARADRILFSGLDLRLGAGEVLHIQGRNGSGKTTLIRMLCGLSRPQEGDITWHGQNIYDGGCDYRGHVSYLGHRRGVCEDLSPLENLNFAQGLRRSSAASDCAAALSQVELARFAHVPSRLLSAGQNQRAALARVLIEASAIWILDEPFTALDASGRTLVERLIADHAGRGGLCVIATHQAIARTDLRLKFIDLDQLAC